MTINISSITCTATTYTVSGICTDKTRKLNIILSGVLDDALQIDENNQKIIVKYFYKFSNLVDNNQMKQTIFTYTFQYVVDQSKEFNHYQLGKTGLFGIIFLTVCIVLTLVICFGWFGVFYYRRFRYRRSKKKLRKELARSVQQMLAKSPIIVFDSKTNKNDHTDDEPMCAICLECFIDNETLRKLECSHYFHTICIDPWLIAHQSCPLCNRNVLSDAIPTISAHVNIRENIPETVETNFGGLNS